MPPECGTCHCGGATNGTALGSLRWLAFRGGLRRRALAVVVVCCDAYRPVGDRAVPRRAALALRFPPTPASPVSLLHRTWCVSPGFVTPTPPFVCVAARFVCTPDLPIAAASIVRLPARPPGARRNARRLARCRRRSCAVAATSALVAAANAASFRCCACSRRSCRFCLSRAARSGEVVSGCPAFMRAVARSTDLWVGMRAREKASNLRRLF